MEKISGGLAEAVLGLQRALGETQEGMARKLGCTLGAYSKWVRGDRTPSGDWLIKMLQLCPDEDTRAAFGVTPSAASVAQAEGVTPKAARVSSSGHNWSILI